MKVKKERKESKEESKEERKKERKSQEHINQLKQEKKASLWLFYRCKQQHRETYCGLSSLQSAPRVGKACYKIMTGWWQKGELKPRSGAGRRPGPGGFAEPRVTSAGEVCQKKPHPKTKHQNSHLGKKKGGGPTSPAHRGKAQNTFIYIYIYLHIYNIKSMSYLVSWGFVLKWIK